MTRASVFTRNKALPSFYIRATSCEVFSENYDKKLRGVRSGRDFFFTLLLYTVHLGKAKLFFCAAPRYRHPRWIFFWSSLYVGERQSLTYRLLQIFQLHRVPPYITAQNLLLDSLAQSTPPSPSNLAVEAAMLCWSSLYVAKRQALTYSVLQFFSTPPRPPLNYRTK